MTFPMSYSPLARKVPGVRAPETARSRRVWGFLIHTTGGGVTDKAARTGKTPLQVAIETYIASQNGANGYFWGGPHYVADFDGTLHQIAPDEAFTAHAGGPNRDKYLFGSWKTIVSSETVFQWQRRWPMMKHPYSMFPSTSPNADYVGLEMIPVGDGFGGSSMAPGLRFTRAQHDAVIALGHDLAKRHQWPDGWFNGGRLVCHEDVDPIERSDAHGGWDPGVMRDKPYFDLEYVKRGLLSAS